MKQATGPERCGAGPVVSATLVSTFDFKTFLPDIPLRPGVYLMRDPGGEILYVGKARELRKRLASYARVDPAGRSKTSALVGRIHSIETIVTNSEKDALILEASLIKQHRPRYNIILRDDKNYPLIRVTVNEDWPRLTMSRRRLNDGARYFGPFSSPSAMWETIRYLHSLFPLRRCKERVLRLRDRPCLNAQMGRCLAPCSGTVGQESYRRMVSSVLLVLEGKNREVMRELEQAMMEASSELRFEEAAVLRDRIKSLARTFERQEMVSAHRHDQDVFGFARRQTSVAVALLSVRRGVVNGQQVFFLADPLGEDSEVLGELLSRYYAEENRPLPEEVVLPFPIAEGESLAEWLSERLGRQVAVSLPQRGQKLRLLAMATTNAEQVLVERNRKAASSEALAAALKNTLHLDRLPKRIECLDISNLGGQSAVGSLVCFVGGEPAPQLYRHYKIRTVSGPDDYAMMAEVLERRFSRGRAEGDLPDLLMVDGGKGQLAVAVRVLAGLGLQDAVELAGIAKEKKEEGEKLYRPGRKNPILLARHAPVLLYLMRIRDEAHRYGIRFHRRLRHKKTLRSALTEVEGVGKARLQLLLKTFGSLTRLAAATEVELAAVAGIGPKLAGRIFRQLHGDGEGGQD